MGTINQRIIEAVLPVVSVCVPDVYDPDPTETPADKYCIFNYTEMPDDFGDDAPGAMRYLCQLHYYAPLGVNTISTRKELRRALHGAGFTYPSVDNATDGDAQHFIFEFEDCDGEV